MTNNRWTARILGSLIVSSSLALPMNLNEPALAQSEAPLPHPLRAAMDPETWRAEQRFVDVHTHIDANPEYFRKAQMILSQSGFGLAVELGSGTVTHAEGEISAFERVRNIARETAPGLFVHHMLLDYNGWDQPDWSQRAVEQVIEGKRLGASGLKEFKRLGLFLRNNKGELLKVDDPKLDPVWAKCGEIGMPVSIHVGDPRAFWEPLNDQNERWEELKDHPNWWFGDSAKCPPRMELLDALSRVIERHRGTTFVTVHFANNPEDLEWVDAQLSKHPNMMADIAARIPEIGRHPPEKLRALFVKHQDRFVFGSDFMVNTRYILGSAGDAERPTDEEALTFFAKSRRFFETDDRDWVHMTPIQGRWKISSVQLPTETLRKVYFDNARKLLTKSWPLPTMQAMRVPKDFVPDGKIDDDVWRKAKPVRMEYAADDASAYPQLSTVVRAAWSQDYLYLAFEAPFTELKTSNTPGKHDRIGLWENDVVEAFIGPDLNLVKNYSEYEWAPNGETLDLTVVPGKKDFEWNSKMESSVSIDHKDKVWRTEARIPLKSISLDPPKSGTRWRLNFYRHDNAHKAFLGWNPTNTNTAHTPEQFGYLQFDD